MTFLLQPSDVILPSGKQYQIHYDEFSNIRQIVLPSLARHTFLYIALPEIHRISYQPPGTAGPYILDYNTHGQLVQTVYPSGHRRVLYHYNDFGLLSETIFDWTDVRRNYDSGTLKLRSAIVETRGPAAYSCSLVYGGAGDALVSSHSVVCSHHQGLELVGADFEYVYDSHFRTVSRQAKFGELGRTVQGLNYSTDTGRLVRMSGFRIDYHGLQREVISDKNVQITIQLDKYSRLADEFYSFNDYMVFVKEVKYDSLGRIHQWRRKISSSDLKAYEYVYDSDGNVIEVLVNSQSSWKYEIDVSGNIVKISHHSSVRNVVINQNNQIESCGQTSYVVDRDGFVTQRDKEVFEYNALGLLVRAFQPDSYDVRFYYDPDGRLVAIEDATSNSFTAQFFYAVVQNPDRLTHVYDHRSRKLVELYYDHRDQLFAIRSHDDELHYVALDPQGSPILVLKAMGSVAKQMAYDPLGNRISDTAPDFFLPLGFRCGIFEPMTELVFIGNRVYDSRVGRWMAPDYHAFIENVEELSRHPEMANLYQNFDLNSRHSTQRQLFPGWLVGFSSGVARSLIWGKKKFRGGV